MKRFSVEKFVEDCELMGDSLEVIDIYKERWANKCDGLTEEEMNESGYLTDDYWMVECDD